LVVTTFLSAGACKDTSSEEASDESSNDSQNIPDYCIDIEDMAVCDSEPGCAWDPQNNYCLNICYMIVDQAECEAIEKCAWYTDGEDQPGTETSGTAYCGEPFT
jgi:hypothetical protein